MGAVTIHDVARLANVSIATVSNTMNRPARVAAETRGRVLAAADELGYVPHAIAAHRARSTHRRIGIIAPITTYASFAGRIQGMLSELGEHVEPILLDHPSASRSPSPRLATLPFSGDLDGLVIMGVPVDDSLAARLVARELPTVLVDSRHPAFTSVVLDDDLGARAAAAHLRERGCTRFVYVTEGQRSNDYVSQGRRRLTGFVRALEEAGVPISEVHCLTARSGDAAAGASAAEVIVGLARDAKVGVLAGHDVLAAGVIAGLRELRVDVPGRVGVIGWDGGELVEALGLTTIHQPLRESGRVGARRLLALMADPTTPIERTVLAPRLRVGITT